MHRTRTARAAVQARSVQGRQTSAITAASRSTPGSIAESGSSSGSEPVHAFGIGSDRYLMVVVAKRK
jgi:hypothetical protein